MHLILLSGGSGNRLWPLSTPHSPKQFLKLLPPLDSSGSNISMIQRIWQQLLASDLADKAIISTSSSQVDGINNQLGPSLPLVIEPSCRDTYPAILLASLYLYSQKQISPDEVIVSMPVDAYVNNDFFDHLKLLEDTLKTSHADLALVGIEPTTPSEKYGYIVPNKSTNPHSNESFQTIKRFTEKPSQSVAQTLIDEGALWNGGIFGFKLKFLLNHLQESQLPLSYHKLLEMYNDLPKISFDFKVVENTSNMVVTTYKGNWKDLGTWNTLSEELSNPLMGKGIISSDCENTHLINELDIPISILGLSNLIVVATPDGILISDKEASPRVKDLLNKKS